MQAVAQTLQRKDGSEVKIVATPMVGRGLAISVDVYVLHRESSAHNWRVANDRPHPDWRKMSVSDYVKHGRSEMLRLVTHGEILKVTSAVFADERPVPGEAHGVH